MSLEKAFNNKTMSGYVNDFRDDVYSEYDEMLFGDIEEIRNDFTEIKLVAIALQVINIIGLITLHFCNEMAVGYITLFTTIIWYLLIGAGLKLIFEFRKLHIKDRKNLITKKDIFIQIGIWSLILILL